MFGFFMLMSFGESLATKCISLSDVPCMARLILIEFNCVELKYYSFVISLLKNLENCNFFDDLSIKICIPGNTKDIHFKVFNKITNRNEAKTMAEHISCNCKCKFNITTCNLNHK